MRRATFVFVALAGLVLIGGAVSSATQSVNVSYNGRLTNSVGDPVTAGSYNITFRIFRDLTGGAALWSDTYNVPVDADGLFSVLLGPIDASVFYDPAYSSGYGVRYLEIQVDGDSPMTPRNQISASPYASVAQKVSGDMITAPGSVKLVDTTGDTLSEASVSSTSSTATLELRSLYNTGLEYDTAGSVSIYSNGSEAGLGLALNTYSSIAMQADTGQSFLAFFKPPTMESVAFTKMLLADGGVEFHNPGPFSKSPQLASPLATAKFGLSGIYLVDTTGDTLYQTSSTGSSLMPELYVFDSVVVGLSAKSAEAATTRLRVNGVIYSNNGGFKFPDGTTQLTAAGPGGGLWKTEDMGAGVALVVSTRFVTIGADNPVGKFNVDDTSNTIAGFFHSKRHAVWAEVGVDGATNTGNAVVGECYGSGGDRRGAFLYGESDSTAYGIIAQGTGTGAGATVYGVYATAQGMGTLKAGYFDGDVDVVGTLSKSAGSFKIDDPIDPENKYLYHSFVESPDMMNVYNGNVVTDASGEAVVTLPDYFEALNKDFRYQLTVIGQFAQAIVEKEIDNGGFTIRTDKPNVKVSWQVTGIRNDAYARTHRIPVEVDKPMRVRGTYLQPEAFGVSKDRSETKAPGYARVPSRQQ